jgi:hypothetical protein
MDSDGQSRRRARPALSCIQCRSRKIRCDRNDPCASCIKAKIVNCTYEEARRLKPRVWDIPSSSNAAGGSITGTTDASHVSTPVDTVSYPTSGTSDQVPDLLRASPSFSGAASVGSGNTSSSLVERVRQLEQQLSEALNSKSTTAVSAAAPRPSRPSDVAFKPSISRLAKTRYFGQSHWMNGAKFVRHSLRSSCMSWV